MKHTLLSLQAVAFLLAAAFLLLAAATMQAQPRVMRIVVHGSINPASAKYVHDAIAEAVDTDAEAVVLELNTPGEHSDFTYLLHHYLEEAWIPPEVFSSSLLFLFSCCWSPLSAFCANTNAE